MNLSNPNTAITAIEASLAALRLPASFDAATPPAFDKVKVFDLRELGPALEELFLYAHRVCLIGLEAIEHPHQLRGSTLIVSQSLALTLIFSDRRYSDRQKALRGDATTPGALLLRTLLVNALAGEQTSGCFVLPETGRLVGLELDTRKNEPGRIIFTQQLSVFTDWEVITLTSKSKFTPFTR